MNFKDIRNNYGKHVLKNMKKYANIIKKLAKAICRNKYLLKNKHNHIYPKFINNKMKILNSLANQFNNHRCKITNLKTKIFSQSFKFRN